MYALRILRSLNQKSTKHAISTVSLKHLNGTYQYSSKYILSLEVFLLVMLLDCHHPGIHPSPSPPGHLVEPLCLRHWRWCLQYGSLIVHRIMNHTSGIVTSHYRSTAMCCYNLLYICVKMSRVFRCTNNTNLQRGWSDLAMVSLFQQNCAWKMVKECSNFQVHPAAHGTWKKDRRSHHAWDMHQLGFKETLKHRDQPISPVPGSLPRPKSMNLLGWNIAGIFSSLLHQKQPLGLLTLFLCMFWPLFLGQAGFKGLDTTSQK